MIVSRNKIKYDKNKTRNIADRVTKLTGSYENEPLQTYNIEETVVDTSKEKRKFHFGKGVQRTATIYKKQKEESSWVGEVTYVVS